MGKTVTLADVAERSGVSVSTASLALRNRPSIPLETRQRVLEAAQALGYRPKAPASPAGRPESGLQSLGLIIKSESKTPPRGNPFYSYVIAGIEEACRRKHINLLYANLPVDEDNRPVEVPRLLTERHVDGLLLVGALVDEALRHLFEERAEPVVLVDAYAPGSRYDAVVTDNRAGAYAAVSHLIRAGHRHIGLVGSHPQAYPSIRERREGYLQALRDFGVAETYFADAALVSDQAQPATAALLAAHPQITALFGCNDHVAIDAIRVARELGRRVPEDLSVCGFDDIDAAALVAPALTTMRIDKVGMGRLAVQLLANRVDFPEAEPVTALIQPRLVERASVVRRA